MSYNNSQVETKNTSKYYNQADRKSKNLNYSLFLTSISIVCMIIMPNISICQEKVVLNYRNLFIQIEEDIPFKFSGLVEIIKPDVTLSCYRLKYSSIYIAQKNQFKELIKKIEDYSKNKKFSEKCALEYILQILKKAHDYINAILDIKIKWAECNIKHEVANKEFEKLWKELFYKFNEKPKPKKKFGEDKEEVKKDSPTDEENYLCFRNAPYLFCEIVHYILFRFFIKKAQEEKVYYKRKKVEISNSIIEGIYKHWQEPLKDICSEPPKIDYMKEADSDEIEFENVIEEPSPPPETSK
ncbi:MAG: hypothetical protein ACK4NF_06335 [Planctomycetota bacterium]